MVSQEKTYASYFYRDDDGEWWVDTFTELQEIVKLPCPEMEVSLVDIYEGISFKEYA